MYLRLPGFSMFYEVIGHGIPLLLIHAFPLNRFMWETQKSILSDEAQLIIPDMRGFGKSDYQTGAYQMEVLADDCMGLLEAVVGDQPAVIGGLSMGGYVTLSFYRKYPHKVAGLILAGTRASADTPDGKLNRELAVKKTQEMGVEALVSGMLPKMMAPKTYTTNPELVLEVEQIMMSASVEGVMGALLGMKDRVDSMDLLANIDVPTIIMHGNDDQLIPIQAAEDMHNAIQNSRLLIIPEAGHLLNLEQPQVFNQTVREFLRSI